MSSLIALTASIGLGCGDKPHISSLIPRPPEGLKKVSITFEESQSYPPLHMPPLPPSATPKGLTPDLVRKAYNLPGTGGAGKTIAIIIAFDTITNEAELGVFSSTFGLPECTTANGCFEKYLIDDSTPTHWGWSMEAALDIQWAHAIAPEAKILVIHARSNYNPDLLEAVDYARKRSDVVAVSMSWGGGELDFQKDYDSYFTSAYPMSFFAASGDSGHGVIWPANSPNVIAVGGTLLTVMIDGTFVEEKAWRWSGGGYSQFSDMPTYQTEFGLDYRRPDNSASWSNGVTEKDSALPLEEKTWRRATPDVAYNAAVNPGFSVYLIDTDGKGAWYQLGGTSAGTPQWAAIQALGGSVTNENLYKKAKSADYSKSFRDITTGHNGYCGWLCQTRVGYDYATGLGSPQGIDFK